MSNLQLRGKRTTGRTVSIEKISNIMVTGINYFVHILYMHIVRELYFRVIKNPTTSSALIRPLNVYGVHCTSLVTRFEAGITPRDIIN